MVQDKKEIPVINTTVGKTFDIYLQSMTGCTGYDWYLTALPEGLVLIDITKQPMVKAATIAPMRVIFTLAADKVGNYTVAFKKLRIWQITCPVETMEYQVVVAEAGLEKRLGSDKFVDMATHMEHFAGPIPPYGFTIPEAQVLDGTIHPLYAFPPPHLLYGFPPMMEYGFPPELKYGFPPNLKYGFPCELSNVVEDKDRCVVMYGTPWGVAKDMDHCNLKYGFPIGLKENMVTFPKGVVDDKNNCVVRYGTPSGIAVDKDKCNLKYGFPPTK